MEILRVILGSTGLIGSAWKRFHTSSVAVERSVIEDWFSNESKDSLAKFLDSLPNDREIEIHFCFGNTNSVQSLNLLMQVNCEWPLVIAKQALMRNFRIVTYGSALEIFGIRNNYFDSKRAFAAELAALETKNLWTNVNLHTLYSDSSPHPHMFLGQIYSSLRDKTQFHMSSGMQLREFHYVDDDVAIIDNALRLKYTQNLEISHGKPLKLIQVAEHLFDSFALSDLLKRNKHIDNPNDNYSRIFTAKPYQDTIIHRDPLTSLQSIFAKLLKQEKVV